MNILVPSAGGSPHVEEQTRVVVSRLQEAGFRVRVFDHHPLAPEVDPPGEPGDVVAVDPRSELAIRVRARVVALGTMLVWSRNHPEPIARVFVRRHHVLGSPAAPGASAANRADPTLDMPTAE